MPIVICQTHFGHLIINKMYNFRFLVLFGLLALSHAKPEGYSYPRPQILPQPAILPQQNQPLQRLTLHQGQQSSSFQQSLPIVQESQPLQLSLNQGHHQHSEQGYSYQQPQPQLHVQPQPQFNVQQPQPQFHVQVQQPQPHFTVQQQQPQFNVQQQQPQFNEQVQQPQPQFTVQQQQPQFTEQVQQPQPQFTVQQQQPQFNVQLQQPQPQLNVQIPVPQANLNNFQASLQESLPQIPIQPQVQFTQVEQNSGSFHQNSLPENNLLVNSQQDLSGGFGQNNFAEQQASLVTKHISIHVAPEDPEEVPQVHAQPLPARKNYKIIFIKAPTVGLSRSQIVAQQQQVHEKTLVYVLVNKPHESELVLPTPEPAPVSKPEVYFIKYKSRNGNGPSLVEGGDSSASGPTGAGLPIVEDIARGQGLVNSGESSSSLFSGGLSRGPSAQYGVPGYQKRSTQK